MQTTISSQHIVVDPNTLEATTGQETTALTLAQSAAQSLRALLGLKLAPLGLALGQDRVLFTLEPRPRMTISEIADAVNVRPSTVSKMMDRLEDRGLAKRSPSETDARLTHAELTDEGRAVCRKLRVLCEAIDAELQSDLGEDEAKRMVKCLTLLDTVLAKRLRRLR